MFGEGPMSAEELEQIRLSLGMAPSLPGTVATRLLEEVHRLQAEQRLTKETLRELLGRLG